MLLTNLPLRVPGLTVPEDIQLHTTGKNWIKLLQIILLNIYNYSDAHIKVAQNNPQPHDLCHSS